MVVMIEASTLEDATTTPVPRLAPPLAPLVTPTAGRRPPNPRCACAIACAPLPGPPLTYAARDRLEQRDVIVRVRPAAEHLRLQTEAERVIEARSSHLAAVHDVGVDGAIAYLAYQQPAGRTLEALLADGEQSLPIALALTSQLLSALDRRLVHADLTVSWAARARPGSPGSTSRPATAC